MSKLVLECPGPGSLEFLCQEMLRNIKYCRLANLMKETPSERCDTTEDHYDYDVDLIWAFMGFNMEPKL